MEKIKRIGMVVFDAIERLDVSGPLDVLGWTKQSGVPELDIHILSTTGKSVTEHLLGKRISVDGATGDHEEFDLLILPGGDVQTFLQDAKLIEEVGRLAKGSKIVMTVCTGAFLYAQTGLADGKRMTTHWYALEDFRSKFPEVKLVSDTPDRFIRDGHLWSSAGISAGIDATLNLVAAYWDDATSKRCQGVMEYFPKEPWTKEEVVAAGRSAI